MSVAEVTLVREPDLELLDTAAPALVRLRRAGYREFPPASLDRTFRGAATQLVVYRRWLRHRDEALLRIAAVSDDRLVGHVAVARPHAYLDGVTQRPGRSSCLEVCRLFVDPRAQGRGIGGSLLAAATAEVLARRATPVLAVLDESITAQQLYRHHGWVEEATFDGVQGLDHLMVYRGERLVG